MSPPFYIINAANASRRLAMAIININCSILFILQVNVISNTT